MTIGVVVLAAGRGRRFGSDKRVASLPDGRRVIDATLANIRASALPMLVCVGQDDGKLVRDLEVQDIPCKRCRRAGEGMGGTLADAAGYISGWSGVLIALADMPWIASATYSAVAEQLHPDKVVVPVHGGKRGHPVGFGRRFYQDIAMLNGDMGARRLLDKYAQCVTELSVVDAAILQDIDLPGDLAPR